MLRGPLVRVDTRPHSRGGVPPSAGGRRKRGTIKLPCAAKLAVWHGPPPESNKAALTFFCCPSSHTLPDGVRSKKMRRLATFVVPQRPRLAFVGSVLPTPSEQIVFDSLLQARDAHPEVRHVTLRAVGGWVRDKLLSQSPGDMDICLSDMTGERFASAIGANCAVVASNPDKSKHLETAVVRVHGHVIDLTHLRTETYADNSRIPLIGVGSLVQDAMRRDCTLNALYYNLDTRAVEDPTGRGLADLQAGLVRTPTAAVLTLRDDPLRLLRLIRFSALFDFRLDEELLAAFGDEEVRSRLERNVSRERILIEFDKMLLMHPEGCAAALARIESIPGLMETVMWRLKNGEWPSSLAGAVTVSQQVLALVSSSKMLSVARLSALLFSARVEETVSEAQVRLKWPTERVSLVRKVLSCAHALVSLPANPTDRQLGMWARSCGPELWELTAELTASALGDRLRFVPLISRLKDGPLAERAFMSPLMRGDEIGRARGIQGVAVGRSVEELIGWQMEAPVLTRDAAMEHLRNCLF